MSRVLAAVAARAKIPFNHVLANRYRDGRDSMGFHAVGEPELGADPVVATVSLGGTRPFVLKPRNPIDGKPLKVELAHGSLLIMGGPRQHHYVHGIPRRAAATDERVSLTFRWVLRSAPGG